MIAAMSTVGALPPSSESCQSVLSAIQYPLPASAARDRIRDIPTFSLTLSQLSYLGGCKDLCRKGSLGAISFPIILLSILSSYCRSLLIKCSLRLLAFPFNRDTSSISVAPLLVVIHRDQWSILLESSISSCDRQIKYDVSTCASLVVGTSRRAEGAVPSVEGDVTARWYALWLVPRRPRNCYQLWDVAYSGHRFNTSLWRLKMEVWVRLGVSLHWSE